MQLHGVFEFPLRVCQAVVAAINASTSAAQAAGRAGRRRTPDAAQLASALAEAASEYVLVFNSTKRSLDESRFVVAVVGRFKAGKSTTINAFLGYRLQPAAVQPETAVPVEVFHAPGRTTPLLRIAGASDQPEELVEGPEAIRARLEAINDAARANPDTLVLYDGRLMVEAPLELLEGLPANETRFSFFDVAGKGEFGAEYLSAASDRILRIANYVIVVMEYTKMNEAEGTAALAQLKQQRPHLFETRPGEAWPRVLVLLNKVDAYSSDEQRSVTPADAPAWVSAQLCHAGVEIPPECILPLSARGALRARLNKLGRAADAEKAELFKDAFGEDWRTQTDEALQAEAVAVLNESGLAAVEERLRALYVDTRRQLAASAADEIRAGLAAISRPAEAELAGASEAAAEGAAADEAAAAALACAESLERDVSAGLELPELLEAGPFEAALSHRVEAVLAAGAALASGDAAARAAARNRLDWPEAVARFDAAALEADGGCGGEGTEAEAAARAAVLRAAVERYLAAELRLVPGVAGTKVAEALAGPAAERLHGRFADDAAAIGVPAPALSALGLGLVLAALEAAAGSPPPVQLGEVPPPAKREWTETVTEQRTVLEPTTYEEQESYVENEPRTRVVKKLEPEQYEVDVPVQVTKLRAETRKKRFLGIQIDKYTVHVPYTETEIRKETRVRNVEKEFTEPYVEPVQKQRTVTKVKELPTVKDVPVEKQRVAYSVDRAALAAAGFGAGRPADEAAAAVVRAAAAAVSSPAVVKAAQRALAEAARPALEALNKAAKERAAGARAALAAARADEAEARRVLEELEAARAALGAADTDS
eukprot:tig00020510_g9935.t1